MSIYSEILKWSEKQPGFIKDALRRIISKSVITQNDIDELVQLLKKENGDKEVSISVDPINDTHIPSSTDSLTSYPRLISLERPINICALYNEAKLQFLNNGLTVIYGANGSGKSSYSKILKKLCWSRNSDIKLYKNVFTKETTQQQVDLNINIDGKTEKFHWAEGHSIHPALKSINVFDSNCGEIYINKENTSEYKPIGIDVLEKLIDVLNRMNKSLEEEIALYTMTKPHLDELLNTTDVGKWYLKLETLNKAKINDYIQFNSENLKRKQELSTLLNTKDVQDKINEQSKLKERLGNYAISFEKIESYFNQASIDDLKKLRINFETTKRAYDLFTTKVNEVNTIKGFGSDPWRTLWESAQKFAFAYGMPDNQNISSLDKCVLCQQSLDTTAKNRMNKFNEFISNDISKTLEKNKKSIKSKIDTLNSLSELDVVNFKELNQFISDFESKFNNFIVSVKSIKSQMIKFLNTGENFDVEFKTFSKSIRNLIPEIEKELEQYREVQDKKENLKSEYNNLIAKEFLVTNKKEILSYYDEFKYKNWLKECLSDTQTANISRKIGDLMKDNAINLQHEEFIKHLTHFNSEIASKVTLSKSRTLKGNTLQKCTLNGIDHSIKSIFSEGEQKIIALSNFLAECTIDGRKNTIVLDDPVSSLDINYRESIAKKICSLSLDRQIIVLTHDLSFLRLLMDTCDNKNISVISIDKSNSVSGIITDEIPYLVKNVQERIDTIRTTLKEIEEIDISKAHDRNIKLDSARVKFRMLLERSVEELLSNRCYERFSTKITLKKSKLSGYIATDEEDVDFLLKLFSKYSVPEHDGGLSTISQIPDEKEIKNDLSEYSKWMNSFKEKRKSFMN